MADDRAVPEVYVLWHPSCAIGASIAGRIYSWLRPGRGFGPDVFYRSSPAPGAPEKGLPLPLPGEVRVGDPTSGSAIKSVALVNMQVVIILADDNMIADPTWRYWLTSLAKAPKTPVRRIFLPVALDPTAFNLPNPLADLNFLRPSGLPLCAVEDASFATRFEIVVRSLLKQITEAFCRLLLSPLESTSSSQALAAANDAMREKIVLFLSHAKIDGGVPSRRIRDYIYSQTQLAAFYDENDIPFGSTFARVLQSTVLASKTAALIAVVSERYASRPWCRWELALFRKPVQEESVVGAPERWKLSPIVVVSALDGGALTSGIPEVGNATHIGWSSSAPDQEEQIVTLLLRDVLLGAYHSALGKSVASQRNQIVINWLPDPTTLLRIPRVRACTEALEILYPGRGLSGLELDILDELFPLLSFGSFDREPL
jgi:hypothetical protein